jgi:hypothetical protein
LFSRYFLAQGLFYFVNPAGALEDFAGLGTVGWAYEAVAFHHVDEVGGAAVADAQAALEEAGAGLAELED